MFAPSAGDQHAAEVADMSLDLLTGIRKFEVPHMKGVLVQIRIGLNTGPCVAGEVAATNALNQQTCQQFVTYWYGE